MFVGVDGGTGDMQAVIVDAEGSICGRGTSGPSNDPEVVGRMHPRVGAHVVDSIRQALDEADAEPAQIRALSLNLSGDPTALTLEHASEWLAPLDLAEGTVLAIDQDGLSAWAAAGFPDPAIWVLLGTNCGSEGVRNGRRVAHPLARLDLDAHLGRAVGAATIGSLGLALAIHGELGGSPTQLSSAFAEALHAAGWQDLEDWAANHTSSAERAELFRTVSDVAARGDGVAVDLLRASARSIADATRALARRMHVGQSAEPVTIVLAGNVWRAGGVLLDEFRTSMSRQLPAAELHVNEVSQAQGAALLAMRHAGLERGPEIFSYWDGATRAWRKPSNAAS
jgi:N-acetylglucosamine kinase-like BadF-type ATPase